MQATDQKFTRLVINNKYLDLIPRLSEQDRKRLFDSIKKDGLLIPITVNPQGVILDGHTRYEICKELKTKIKYSVKTFESEEDEMRFVVMTNLARRQLNKMQKIELAWPLYELEKKRAEERVKWRQDKDNVVTNKEGKIVGARRKTKEGLAATLFGKKIGVGKTIISQVEYLKKFAPEKVMEDVRAGKLSVGQGHDLVRGMRLMSNGIKPEKPIQFCPDCNSETTSPMRRTNCHVHKWFCCKRCGWGV